MTDFNDAAQPMTLAEADLAVQKFYGQIRGAEGDQKATIAREMVNSDALRVLTKEAPWQAANLLHATLEYLPTTSQAFSVVHVKLGEMTELEDAYHDAYNWYLKDSERLARNIDTKFNELGERTDKDSNRYAWQVLRRGVLASYKDLPDASKIAVLEKTLASSPILTKLITSQTPWAAVDILSTLVEICPDQYKAAFAQKYFFESEALKIVDWQYPEMAAAFRTKVNGFLPKPQSGPGPNIGQP